MKKVMFTFLMIGVMFLVSCKKEIIEPKRSQLEIVKSVKTDSPIGDLCCTGELDGQCDCPPPPPD